MINLENTSIVTLNASNITAEVLRNVRIITTTIKGSVPYDRDFGLDPEFIDAPIVLAKELYTIEVLVNIRKYEPRANVQHVNFEQEAINGLLIPKVVITIESSELT